MTHTTKTNESVELPEIPLFDNIEKRNLELMLHCLKDSVREYKKGEIIIMDQEDVQYVGIVLSGRVHMIKEDFWGNKSLYSFFHEGDLFGETFAVQKSNKSNVTFIAASNAKILFLSLYHIIHPCPNGCAFHMQISENLYDELGKKNVKMMEKIEVMSKNDLRGKILAYLSIQAQKQDSRYITSPLSRTEMAEYLCANRSSMTRTLSEMREEGIIDYDRNTFVLKDVPAAG